MSQSPLGESENPPVLVLSSLRESHPFQERRIILNEVIKVGRSVARLKPAPNNAIFDCKVLSRSHALIWYKDGKFWLRDTNSSNGTFVNNTRVHKKAGEDFSDREIFSGDIIRFGVDVVERDTTHGCIIAQVTIYLGNGCEAKPNLDQAGVVNGMVGASAFHSEQVFLLFHLANEALFREQSLVDKLDDLKRLVTDVQEMSENSWQAMLREDRLLEKVALYESQLSMLKENLPQDSLQNHLFQALEDKMNLEKASKIMLARILEEKTEAMTKAADLENSLTDSERECARLREVCENTQEAYRTIADEFRTKVKELEQLEQQLKNVTTEKDDLESQLKERVKEAEALQDVMSNVKSNIRNRFTKVPSSNMDDIKESVPAVNGLDNGPTESAEQLGDKVNIAERLQSSLSQRVDAARDKMIITELNELDRLCEVQALLANSEVNFEQMLDSTSDCISSHLSDSVRQFNQSMQLIRSLQDELSTLDQLKTSLMHGFKDTNSIPSTVSCDTSTPLSDSKPDQPDQPNQSDDVSSQLDEKVISEDGFSSALDRAKQLAAHLALSQARAELNLDRYFAQQNHQKAPNVCHTSGDVCASVPSKTGESKNVYDSTDEITTESKVSALTTSIPATESQSTQNSRSCKAESSLDEIEVTQMRRDLLAALSECEQYRLKASEYREQDASKTELLMSVREECDALRSRIAEIESEVATSREDHQRLVSEARRARTEADELRQERDSLTEQVSICHQQMEQLRATLAETLIRTKRPGSQPNSTSNVACNSPETIVNIQSMPNEVQHAMPTEQNKCIATPNSETAVSSPPTQLGITPLFAIIPIMVLLCAVMVIIFSKFAG
ncbi:hypothetical protein D915_002763 [Fasciola hepatica]|uniref:FHA domain-containing protein n=1 Tax=Fasciola hepatica TaxID=6192 RepID=A0A4E0S1J2_FASHE|nr:hypothetical protein D915_002763 [Fasciola hepatica]